MLTGCQKLYQVSVNSRKRINKNMVLNLRSTLPALFHNKYLCHLCKAMFSLALHVFLRVGEYTILNGQGTNILQLADIIFQQVHSLPYMLT